MTVIIPGEVREASRMLSPSFIGQTGMTNRINPDKMSSKASENRRATKPIMEKRRRARINQCLGELKTLILDALNKDPSRHSKLEKADILEMTVRHLQNVQRQQMAAAISSDPTVLNKFRAGFSECASEVSRYVNRLEGVEPAVRQRLLGHLSHCINGLNAANAAFSSANGSAFPGMTPPLLSHLQALNVHIPGVPSLQPFLPNGQQQSTTDNANTDINNNNSQPAPSAPPSSPPPTPSNSSSVAAAKLLSGLSLIPSRLPNGDLAFLLPSQALQGPPGHLLGALTEEGRLPPGNGWGPPTPTSPTLSRRSSACSPGASSSCLSPTESSSEQASDDESQMMMMDHVSPPQAEPLRLQREPSGPPRQPPPPAALYDPAAPSSDPVWRPW